MYIIYNTQVLVHFVFFFFLKGVFFFGVCVYVYKILHS